MKCAGGEFDARACDGVLDNSHDVGHGAGAYASLSKACRCGKLFDELVMVGCRCKTASARGTFLESAARARSLLDLIFEQPHSKPSSACRQPSACAYRCCVLARRIFVLCTPSQQHRASREPPPRPHSRQLRVCIILPSPAGPPRPAPRLLLFSTAHHPTPNTVMARGKVC